jgi:hypothetical protein
MESFFYCGKTALTPFPQNFLPVRNGHDRSVRGGRGLCLLIIEIIDRKYLWHRNTESIFSSSAENSSDYVSSIQKNLTNSCSDPILPRDTAAEESSAIDIPEALKLEKSGKNEWAE